MALHDPDPGLVVLRIDASLEWDAVAVTIPSPTTSADVFMTGTRLVISYLDPEGPIVVNPSEDGTTFAETRLAVPGRYVAENEWEHTSLITINPVSSPPSGHRARRFARHDRTSRKRPSPTGVRRRRRHVTPLRRRCFRRCGRGIVSVLVPSSGFTDDEHDALIKTLGLAGFSSAAFTKWYEGPPKMSSPQLEKLFGSVVLESVTTRTYLDGMLVSALATVPSP